MKLSCSLNLLCCIFIVVMIRKTLSFKKSMISSIINGRSTSISSSSLLAVKIDQILANPKFPPTWPYRPADFKRQDESIDTDFYYQPRLVYHIDDNAVKALTNYYSKEIKPNSNVLDICSSWVSHYPDDAKFNKAVGLGMNKYELSQNKQLSEYVVQDLNKNPVMPFEDNTFDYVTCVVSVDYLTRPLEIFSEINRVLKTGGTAIISQSNRCFPTKAINIWLNTNDYEHIFIIGSYFHYAGKFSPPSAEDITIKNMFGAGGDPMYIIKANKL